MGRRIAGLAALAVVILSTAAANARETQLPLALPGEPIPASVAPASVLRPAVLRTTFRVPRTETALYVAGSWLLRDMSITIVGPGRQRRTLVAEASLPGRTLGVRLPLNAPSADRLELTATAVSGAGTPYLVTAEHLAALGWRNWWYGALFGVFLALCATLGALAVATRSRAGAWLSVAAGANAVLTVPWLGIVRPPPQVSQPAHAFAESVGCVAVALLALSMFGGVRLSRSVKIGLGVVVVLNVAGFVGLDVLQDLWYVPDLVAQFSIVAFGGALLALGIAARRARCEGATVYLAGTVLALVGFALDAGPSPWLRAAAATGTAAQLIAYAIAIIPRLRLPAPASAHPDGLTGLANRAAFDEAVSRAWNHAHRMRRAVSVVLVDIDYFKTYNDLYGHLAGDDVMVRVAAEVGSVAGRFGATAGRYAGDKFALLVPEASPARVRSMGDIVRNAIAALEIAHTGAPSRRLSVAAGVATVQPLRAGNGDELLLRAATALHLAKTLGRDRVIAAEPVLGEAPVTR